MWFPPEIKKIKIIFEFYKFLAVCLQNVHVTLKESSIEDISSVVISRMVD